MRRLAALAVLLVVAPGCMGGAAAAIDKAELERVVLQPGDLPRAFIRFDEGRQTRIDQPGGTLADVERFGRRDGWKARYRRPGSASTPGPLVVESKADAFDNADGARQELDAAKARLAEGLRLEDAEAGVGDDGFVATGTQGSGRFAVRFYLVAWRFENATASVLANGFEGRFTREQALALARKQQIRLEAAS